MTWNFRIVNKDGNLGIHEVFYDGEPCAFRGLDCVCVATSVTVDPIDVTGENLEDIKDYYNMMGEAFDRPILDYNKIGK
jgi:hypothetical protein